MRSYYELIVVPDNPLMPAAYPPLVLLEADGEEQARAWFKEAQEQGGQYAGHHVHVVMKAGDVKA